MVDKGITPGTKLRAVAPGSVLYNKVVMVVRGVNNGYAVQAPGWDTSYIYGYNELEFIK